MDVEYNMKAAIWVRVSTTEQETENQLSNLKAWAAAKDLEVVETYSINESAYRGAQRNALEAMYRDAHQGRFQVLLVWSLDRLSREGIRKTLEIFNQLSGHGVRVLRLPRAMDGIRRARNPRTDDLNHRLDRQSIRPSAIRKH